ncbi:serine/arginine repetitive matrix protein 3-like [Clupea harengus]|uniref:Serine/arginine repetitive matrix protein 3-like n=1 Tax=Clupea harengus TaxID=7950 RepID=A0A6P8FPH2_CLUHA|nr:serine/arginine repetitive matrix protein 3-like [Clupea harengus]
MYDGARVPSPQDSANGFPQQPGASTVRPKSDQEPEAEEQEEDAVRTEPVLVKKAHREILDHERKRRVELKCMELQEMMEEQGYSEVEVRQKVGTFRQMLMEKEGVITREGQPPVGLLPHSDEEHLNEAVLADGYEWQGGYYDGDYSTKRKSSSSPSPRPKKRKKKKSGRKRSREKRKRSSRRHKRDRCVLSFIRSPSITSSEISVEIKCSCLQE